MLNSENIHDWINESTSFSCNEACINFTGTESDPHYRIHLTKENSLNYCCGNRKWMLKMNSFLHILRWRRFHSDFRYSDNQNIWYISQLKLKITVLLIFDDKKGRCKCPGYMNMQKIVQKCPKLLSKWRQPFFCDIVQNDYVKKFKTQCHCR